MRSLFVNFSSINKKPYLTDGIRYGFIMFHVIKSAEIKRFR